MESKFISNVDEGKLALDLLKELNTAIALYEVAYGENGAADLRYIYVNDVYLSNSKHSKEEVLGKLLSEILPENTSWIPVYADIALGIKNAQTFETFNEALNLSGNTYAYSPTHGQIATVINMGTRFAITELNNEHGGKLSNQLDAARHSLQTLMDTLPLPVEIVDKETSNVVYGNSSFVNMMETGSPEALYRLNGVDKYAHIQSDGTTADVIVKLLSGLKKPIVKEVQLRSIYNNLIDVRMYSSPIEYNGKRAVINFMLELRREKEYQMAQQALQTVLDSLPVPIRILDFENEVISYINNAAADMFGILSSKDAIGLSAFHFMPEVQPDGTPSLEKIKGLNHGAGTGSDKFVCLKANGEPIETYITACVMDFNGRKSSLGVIQNLTAEKEYQKTLIDVVEREREANQAKSRFLATMSHEIRTPMNGIIGMSDLLLGEPLSTRHLQYVKDIKASAESLLSIINDILDISKIGEGKLQITPVDIDLNVLIKNIVSMMNFTARSKELDFIDDIRINSQEYVRTDDVRLRQVIINLLSNAIKFTKTGYVKLMAKIEDGLIVFEVTDTGVGIKNEDLPLIFVAFEQADKRKNRAIRGTGLGLSITKNLVELMGGRIWVESEYGAGSTFHVTIPYVPGDESAVEVENDDFKYIYAPTAHVLLVDDIQTNLTVGAGLLRLCGITASVALSGSDAIEHVKEKDFDIVFMDHMMPEMDGIKTMEHIRKLGGKYLDLPIIALTANAVSESRSLLLAAGMNDFLSKPIDKRELMQMLHKWIPAHKVEIGSRHSEIGLAASYSEELNEIARIEGLDIELALSRISGMSEVLETSIRQVASSVDDELKKMDACLASGDLYNFSIMAHGLKGALSNIGAINNSELAADLEIASKAGNTLLCVNKFAVFASVMEKFSIDLKKVFVPAKYTNRPQGDGTLLMHKIGEAITCLHEFEMESALKCLDELSKYTFGPEKDAVLRDATNEIQSFRYENAILLLDSLLPHPQE